MSIQIFNSKNSNLVITGNRDIVNGLGGDCIHGNGELKKEVREVSDFTRIKVNGSADVLYQASTELRLVLIADSNLTELITTEVVNNELIISSTGSYSTSNKIIIECGSAYVDRVNIKGSGDVELETVSGPRLDICIKGSGDVKAAGAVKALNVEVKGSGDVDLSELKSDIATLTVKGSGDIRANVSNELSARVSGSGDIKIKGNPPLRNITENGSGRIKFK